jgi:hypothetical protein
MNTKVTRRDFLNGASAVAAASLLPASTVRAAELPAAPAKAPRWRGFSLLEKFIVQRANASFREQDLAWIAEWGFNFVRLPMSWGKGSDQWPEPTWPLEVSPETAARERSLAELLRKVWHANSIAQRAIGRLELDAEWNRVRLERQVFRPWKVIEPLGVPVRIDEFGVHSAMPHRVVLAWMRDFLALSKNAGWGWALWGFRGGSGVLDGERSDVKDETFRGHQLDREMLGLLRSG